MTLTVVLYRETTLLRKRKCKLCIIVEQLFKLESWSSVQLRFLLHQNYKVRTMKNRNSKSVTIQGPGCGSHAGSKSKAKKSDLYFISRSTSRPSQTYHNAA